MLRSIRAALFAALYVPAALAAETSAVPAVVEAAPPPKPPHVLVSGYAVPNHPGNLYYSVKWRVKEGLNIGLTNAKTGESILISFDGQKAIMGEGSQKGRSRSVRDSFQRDLSALPTVDKDKVELTIKFRPETWRVYLDNRPLCSLRPPFPLSVTVSHPEGDLLADGESDPFFQKTAGFVFEDNFLAEADAENRLGAWQIESGAWKLHSVLDSLTERDEVPDRSEIMPQAELSPNFYSLKGSGEKALITSGYDFYDSYSVKAAMQTAAAEMGVVFMFEDAGRYFSFTLDMRKDSHNAVLRLKRHVGDDKAPETMAAARTSLTYDQWVKLRVIVGQDRVRCFMDQSLVFDVETQLPGGGRFGLFVESNTGVRFDDVSVTTHKDLDLRNMSDLRGYVVTELGNFLPTKLPSQQEGSPDGPIVLKLRAKNEAQQLVVGAVSHKPHVFSARFKPSSPSSTAGLLVGYSSESAPYYRFTSSQSETNTLVAVEKVMTGSIETVETFRYPAGQDGNKPFTLMADACSGGGLRLYRNDELVVVLPDFASADGASGLYVAPGSSLEISDLAYRFKRDDIYRNVFEKNRTFLADPYMRHWSSPEGEWITGKDGLTWFKGDFFGRFSVRLPFAVGSEVNFGVSENSTTGMIRLAVDENAVHVFADEKGKASTSPTGHVLKEGLSAVQMGTYSAACYTLHHEDYWVWITSGGKVLFKHRLREPLKGRRLRIAGFGAYQLKFSSVDRYQVKDCLFTQSLHDWTVNGGAWEVVNRFECQPRWSHMIGQSRDTIAALWAKYMFEGDFCVEMYAGLRHGWYERIGDLNMTVLNDGTSPSKGYTVTCSGWDRNHSQLYTRLFRNGKEIARSDKYTVPRTREGSERRGYNPMVPSGRPVHGAWYFIKFRRVGKRLEYYFDNELVFSTEDPNPLSGGSLGIWTFMNSMVVARVKIAAEGIRHKTASFTPLALRVAEAGGPAPAKSPWSTLTLLKGYRPWFWTWPGNWEVDDPVGRGTLSWERDKDGMPYFVMENTLGSGSMFTRCKTIPSRINYVAGWRFFIKRTPETEVNFHFSVGSGKGNDTYVPRSRFFHRISGDDFSEAKLTMVGATDVPATKTKSRGWHAEGEWIPVDVWLPAEASSKGATHVKVEGFGNAQPSDVIQGLSGNGPGEGYAVKGFAEISYDGPTLSLPADAPPLKQVTLRDAASRKPLVSCKSMEELNKAIGGLATTGYIRTVLEVQTESVSAARELNWVMLPGQPSLTCFWHDERPGQFVITREGEFPDPRMRWESVRVNGEYAEVIEESTSSITAILPSKFAFGPQNPDIMNLVLSTGKEEYDLVLKRQDTTPNIPPVLLGIDGLTPFFRNFEYDIPEEQRRESRSWHPDERVLHRRGHSERGGYFEVINRGEQERLMLDFDTSFSLAKYPILQMTYLGDPMANISIAFGVNNCARFSEKGSPGRFVRGVEPITMNNTWQVWRGLVSDVMIGSTENKFSMQAGEIKIGSLSREADQTGLFSKILLDDLVLGPAVSDSAQLTFTPWFHDADGIAAVELAVCTGPGDVAQLISPGEPIWQDYPPGKAITPQIGSLPDGLCRILLRARDSKGAHSRVTEIPVLLDRERVKGTCTLTATEGIKDNGSRLQATFATGAGSPLDADSLEMRLNGEPFKVTAGTGRRMVMEEDKVHLSLNWPLVFKKTIDRMNDGDTATVTFTGIRDGAGNESPPVSTPITMNHAADKKGPTLLEPSYPDSVFWASNWDDARVDDAGMRDPESPYTSISLVRDAEEGTYCKIEMPKGRGRLKKEFGEKEWMADKFPFVGFRVRRKTMEKEETPYFSMSIYLSNGQKLSYRLGYNSYAEKRRLYAEKYGSKGKSRKSYRVKRDDSPAWLPGEWKSVILDMNELKTSSRSEKLLSDSAILDGTWVKMIAFGAAAYNSKPVEMHLQSLFAFSTWGKEDEISMRAYDASGIGEYVSSLDRAEVQDDSPPVDLLAGQGLGKWLTMRARDKAGNLSPPVRIPCVGYPEPEPQPAAKPEPAVKKPEPQPAANPESAVKKPEPQPAVNPEPVVKKPELQPTAKPEPAVKNPKPPVAVKPEPVVKEPGK
jgi:hypothetical protein